MASITRSGQCAHSLPTLMIGYPTKSSAFCGINSPSTSNECSKLGPGSYGAAAVVVLIEQIDRGGRGERPNNNCTARECSGQPRYSSRTRPAKQPGRPRRRRRSGRSFHSAPRQPPEAPRGSKRRCWQRGDNTLAQNNKTPVVSCAYEVRFPGLPGQMVTFVRSNMPDQPVSDPQYFRNLARKSRVKADHTSDDVTKQLLLRIAETYERVADRVEQRLPDAEKSK